MSEQPTLREIPNFDSRLELVTIVQNLLWQDVFELVKPSDFIRSLLMIARYSRYDPTNSVSILEELKIMLEG